MGYKISAWVVQCCVAKINELSARYVAARSMVEESGGDINCDMLTRYIYATNRLIAFLSRGLVGTGFEVYYKAAGGFGWSVWVEKTQSTLSRYLLGRARARKTA